LSNNGSLFIVISPDPDILARPRAATNADEAFDMAGMVDIRTSTLLSSIDMFGSLYIWYTWSRGTKVV